MDENYFNSNEFKEILEKYERALNEGDATFLDADELTDVADYYHSHGKSDKALEAVEQALYLFPHAAAPLVFMARSTMLRENNPEKAREYLAQVDDQDDPDYHYAQAEILIGENKIEEADTYLKAFVENMDPDQDEYQDYIIDIALLYTDFQAYDKAWQWLQQSELTDSADYKEILGRIAIGNGNFDKGERIFNELIDQNPFSCFYWNQLAASQLSRNSINEAITSSEYSIAINPNDTEAIMTKSNAMFQLGNYEEAVKGYQRLTELMPQEETGEMLLGETLLLMARPKEAAEHLKKAERIAGKKSPNANEIWQQLSFALSSLGQVDEALMYLDKAEAGGVDPAEMMVIRAHIYLENDHVKEARNYYHQAIRMSGASPQIFIRIALSIYDNGYHEYANRMFEILADSGYLPKGIKPEDYYEYTTHHS